jgi:hypothetical protein
MAVPHRALWEKSGASIGSNGFLRALSAYDGAARTRLALGLAVLTFVRTMELRRTVSTILPKTERLSSIILDAPRSPSSLIFGVGCGFIFRDLDVEVANQARPPLWQVFAQVREQRRPVAIIVAARSHGRCTSWNEL